MSRSRNTHTTLDFDRTADDASSADGPPDDPATVEPAADPTPEPIPEPPGWFAAVASRVATDFALYNLSRLPVLHNMVLRSLCEPEVMAEISPATVKQALAGATLGTLSVPNASYAERAAVEAWFAVLADEVIERRASQRTPVLRRKAEAEEAERKRRFEQENCQKIAEAAGWKE